LKAYPKVQVAHVACQMLSKSQFTGKSWEVDVHGIHEFLGRIGSTWKGSLSVRFDFLRIVVEWLESHKNKPPRYPYHTGSYLYNEGKYATAYVDKKSGTYVDDLRKAYTALEKYRELIPKGFAAHPPSEDRHLENMVKIEQLLKQAGEPCGDSQEAWKVWQEEHKTLCGEECSRKYRSTRMLQKLKAQDESV
jgi:hypothetical protein